mgnify:CR=1 FL=1
MMRCGAEGLNSPPPGRAPRACNAVFIVEMLEPFVSRWLFLELLHVSEIVGRERLWITRVRRECERRVLSALAAVVTPESISELEGTLPSTSRVIVLDPAAEKPLSPEDFEGPTYVVIGGIMGSHPPSGRTRKELTSRLRRAVARNIGRHQLTIDGAAYVAVKVCEGRGLESVRTLVGLTLQTRIGRVELPYAYPLGDEGELIIARGEIDYILLELEDDERAMIRGRRRDICVSSPP